MSLADELRFWRIQRTFRTWRLVQAAMRLRHQARQVKDFESADRVKRAITASGFLVRDFDTWTWWETAERIAVPSVYVPRPFLFGYVGRIAFHWAHPHGLFVSAAAWLQAGSPQAAPMFLANEAGVS